MLSLHAIKSASEAGKYYQQDNYYTSGDTARQTSEWHGKGAELLGLSGHVTEEDFKRMLSGELPNGTTLGRYQDGKRVHRPGLDMTFSAPKSVSILSMIGGDERLIKAHQRAVNQVLDYIEKNYSYTRVKDESGELVRERVGNLTIAKFLHDVSRLMDPQLHTHAVLLNAALRSDGKWRSLDMVDVFRQKIRLGTMYRSALAKEVVKLGYSINRTGKGCMFEISDVPNEVIKNFSKRREDIKDMLGNFREKGGKAASVAALITRSRKQSLSQEEKSEIWHKQAEVLNFDAKAVVAAAKQEEKLKTTSSLSQDEFGLEVKANPKEDKSIRGIFTRGVETAQSIWQLLEKMFSSPEDHPVHNLEGVALSVEHLSERNSRFDSDALERAAADFTLGNKDMKDIGQTINDMLDKGELLGGYTDEGGYYYTTPELRRIEQENLSMLDASKKAVKPIMNKKEITAGLAKSPANEGQKACITLALNCKDRVIGIQGHAGVGKTFMMKEAKRLMDGKGWEFIGMAPSASAARTLQKDAGIKSHTISRFLATYDNFIQHGRGSDEVNKKMQNKVILVDEASLASSQQVNNLLKFSKLTNTKLIFMGDTKQLGAVEAGCPFHQLIKHGMRIAEMTNIMRQKCPKLLQAVYQTIDGIDQSSRQPFEETIKTLENNIIDTDEMLDEVVNTWKELSPAEREDTLLIAPSNELRREINDDIRKLLVNEGTIKKGGIKFNAYENKNMTTAELKYFRNYVPGNVLTFTKGWTRHGFRANEELKIIKSDDRTNTVTLQNEKGKEIKIEPGRLPTKLLKEASLYQKLKLTLAEGDQLRWTKNGSTDKDIINGHKIEVLAVNTEQIKLKTEEGKVKEVSLKDPALKHIDYAFSSTVHAAQGRTNSRVIAALESEHKHLANQRIFYVSISRAENNLHIITQDKKEMAKSLSENSGAKGASLDIKMEEMSL
jgi:conjugative relaxase-like TrwC/TraI family protein